MSQLKDLVVTGKARFIGKVYADNIIGKIAEADVAYKDTLNQNIDTTYIKDISVSGKTVTFTKGNGSTYSFDTQDTTYTKASDVTLGLIKVGNNLTIDENGVLSSTGGGSSKITVASETISSAIADGENSDIITFEFNCTEAVSAVEFFANVNLLVSTTVGEEITDCTLTITYILDDVTKATLTQTYTDGYNIISLNYILSELTQGNHVFKVNFAPVGGSIS